MTRCSGPSASSVCGTYGVPTKVRPMAAIAVGSGTVSSPCAFAHSTFDRKMRQSSSIQGAAVGTEPRTSAPRSLGAHAAHRSKTPPRATMAIGTPSARCML